MTMWLLTQYGEVLKLKVFEQKPIQPKARMISNVSCSRNFDQSHIFTVHKKYLTLNYNSAYSPSFN